MVVTPGQYLVVQDTKLDRLRVVGRAQGRGARLPGRADGGRRFAVDRAREYLLYTQHAEGYLRRL